MLKIMERFNYKARITRDIQEIEEQVIINGYLVKMAYHNLRHNKDLSQKTQEIMINTTNEDLKNTKRKRDTSYQMAYA